MTDYDQTIWFNEEIKPHEPSLRSWLKRQYPLDAGVDDVLQESYIRILQARQKRPIFSPRAYLYRTARNVAYNFIEKSRMHITEPIEDSHSDYFKDNSASTAELVELNQEIALLHDAIRALPKRCREIFTLRKIYGHSYKEISAKLNISERTVSAQMNIALRKCAEYIKKRSKQQPGKIQR